VNSEIESNVDYIASAAGPAWQTPKLATVSKIAQSVGTLSKELSSLPFDGLVWLLTEGL
jgi:hypothetical protein